MIVFVCLLIVYVISMYMVDKYSLYQCNCINGYNCIKFVICMNIVSTNTYTFVFCIDEKNLYS